MPRPSPFLLHGWLSEWWSRFGAGSELGVRVARRDGRLVAALPLFVHSRFGVRAAGFLGAHESALADLMLAPGEDPATGDRLAEEAAADADLVHLFGLPGGSRLGSALPLRLVQRAEAPVLDLSGGWEATYAAKTSSKRRNLHRRRRRQLAEQGALELSVAREEAELGPALEDAFRLHALRWEGRPDLSSFGTEPGRAFHRAAIRALPAGVPRIVTLRLDGRPVAFHYYFVLERRMFVHRLAFDPALARFSPGQVATLDALEAAAGEGVVRVEFLGGTERYKLELADRQEPLYEGFAASSARGRAVMTAHLARLRLRLALKRSERLRRAYYRGLDPVRRLTTLRRRGPT